MNRIAIMFFTVLCVLSGTVAVAQNVRAGISVTDGQLSGFYFSIGDYYRVPESRVVYVRDHYRVHDEELPVIFFLASRARVDPQVIVNLRIHKRMSWLDITWHFGLTPEVYYVPLRRVGPPYGNAYGHYRKHRGDYRKVRLSDDDVVNLVNLRFISDYHGVAPETVMDRRGRGEKFFSMNREFRDAGRKGNNFENNGKQKEKEKDNNGRGRGKNRG